MFFGKKCCHIFRNHLHGVTEMVQVGRTHWRWSGLTPCSSRVLRAHHSGLWLSTCICERTCYFSSENWHLYLQYLNKYQFSFVLLPAMESYSTCSYVPPEQQCQEQTCNTVLFCVRAAPGTNGQENKAFTLELAYEKEEKEKRKRKKSHSIQIHWGELESSAILQVSSHSELEPLLADFLRF